ncbi:hypothetical protein [Methylophilus flavus]|uniref:hypothetical protein n=1 Tax=Methylophilus flavus TaxID=640084 RepID=UPI00366CFE8A
MNYHLNEIKLAPVMAPITAVGPATIVPSLNEMKLHTASILKFHVGKENELRRQHFFVSYKGKDVVGYAIDSRELEHDSPAHIKNLIRNHIVDAMTEEFMRQLDVQRRGDDERIR